MSCTPVGDLPRGHRAAWEGDPAPVPRRRARRERHSVVPSRPGSSRTTGSSPTSSPSRHGCSPSAARGAVGSRCRRRGAGRRACLVRGAGRCPAARPGAAAPYGRRRSYPVAAAALGEADVAVGLAALWAIERSTSTPVVRCPVRAGISRPRRALDDSDFSAYVRTGASAHRADPLSGPGRGDRVPRRPRRRVPLLEDGPGGRGVNGTSGPSHCSLTRNAHRAAEALQHPFVQDCRQRCPASLGALPATRATAPSVQPTGLGPDGRLGSDNGRVQRRVEP